MREELQAVTDNHTRDVVPLPSGRKAIDCKWVYKVKIKVDRTLEPSHILWIEQLDIHNAFLNGELDKEVYIELPESFQHLTGAPSTPNQVLSQYMDSPTNLHMRVALRVLHYLKKDPNNVGDKKKQSAVARSSTKVEYRALDACACEVMWIQNMLAKLQVTLLGTSKLLCDNRSTIQISKNSAHHDRIKHFDLDVRFVREKV
ncbi:uncharacterized protein LOC127258789 [Andrographis paniculata]|uniref:uncharacterized protein LOC127258789 n=1 Tax=Andrographis paniculata TaxID=175694 RepID=UPI0021E7BF36|nr:uncharacterized protein LOC127258789 [Andrographis paniculata]